MKLILKVLLAPFIFIAYVLILFFTFSLSVSTTILNIAATLLGVLAIATMLLESAANGAVLMIIAWLISPIGLPMLAGCVLDKAEGMRCKLWQWLSA